jgi:nitroreductase
MKKLFFATIISMIAMMSCAQQEQPAQENTDAKNQVIETILARRSVRAYKDQAVPKELLDKVLECGVYAANAMNAQQWEIRVVNSQELLNSTTAAAKEAAKGTPNEAQYNDPSFKNIFRNAPAAIFIAHKPGMYTQVDCGLMAGNIMLAAKSLGLGTVCMAGPIASFVNQPAGAEFRQKLNFSEGYEPLICIGIGYPNEEPAAKPRNMDVIKYVE